MQNNRLKRLMKLAAEGDHNTLQSEANKILQGIEAEKQARQAEIEQLDEQVHWITTTLRYALPLYASTVSKPHADKAGNSAADDGYNSKQRGKLIVDAVTRMINAGIIEFSADDILAELAKNGIVFSIGKPTSAISSVVARMEGVERVSRNHYRYTGNGVQGDALPLMESDNAH